MQQRLRRKIKPFNPCTTVPQFKKSKKITYDMLYAIDLGDNKSEIFWAPELKLNRCINMIKSKHKYTLDKHDTFFIINWKNTIETTDLINNNDIKIVSDTSRNRKKALKAVNNHKQSLIDSHSDSDSEFESELESELESKLEMNSNNKKRKYHNKPTFHQVVLAAMDSFTKYTEEPNPDTYSTTLGLCSECTKDWPCPCKNPTESSIYAKKHSSVNMLINTEECKCGCCVNLCETHIKCK